MEKFLIVSPDMAKLSILYNKRTGQVYTLGDTPSIRAHMDECLEDMPNVGLLDLETYWQKRALKVIPAWKECR